MSKENAAADENCALQAAGYFNQILGMLEKCDQNSYVVECFMERFENMDTLQKSIEEKRMGDIALMSLRYISDLIANAGVSRTTTQLGPTSEKSKSIKICIEFKFVSQLTV